MKVTLYDKTGKKTEKKIELDSAIFGAKVNKKLLSQAVYIYLSNQRTANPQTKDRGEVSGGGRKPWKQKGTGRARHGSTRSPIWRGGGVTFGPTNQKNYKKTMLKKMKRAAIRSAFSYQTEEKKVLVMEKPDFKEGALTKQVLKILNNLRIDKKVLFVQGDIDQNFVKAVSNLKTVLVKPVNELNTYSVLNTQWLIFTDESLGKVSEFWGAEKGKTLNTEKGEEKKLSSVQRDLVKKETKRVKDESEKKPLKKVAKKSTIKKVKIIKSKTKK
ncbi:50S ribosomal protein L4 [Candidatus Dojkabacteria bacterium]|nr:50S ribosomal protein L4 [Candidatus Dojkabacteria bacterium]